jgi:hypothetical protein
MRGDGYSCQLSMPNGAITFADMIYAGKNALVISHLDEVGNRKLVHTERRQVVQVIANRREKPE